MESEPAKPSKQQTVSPQEIEQWLGEIQPDLRAYIISINGSGDDIEDILQETNIFLWQRCSEYTPGSNFKAWAFRVAYFKTMASRRDRIRRGEVVFDESIVQRIAARAENRYNHKNDLLASLQACVSQLKKEELSIIAEKYIHRRSLKDFALRLGKSVDSIHKSVSRIRVKLAHCIRERSTNSQEP